LITGVMVDSLGLAYGFNPFDFRAF